MNETQSLDKKTLDLKGYGSVAITQHTNKSMSIHVPAEVRDLLGLEKKQRAMCEVDVKNKVIVFTVV